MDESMSPRLLNDVPTGPTLLKKKSAHLEVESYIDKYVETLSSRDQNDFDSILGELGRMKNLGASVLHLRKKDSAPGSFQAKHELMRSQDNMKLPKLTLKGQRSVEDTL